MAEERGLKVDVDDYNKAMDEARERSRSAQNKVFNILLFYMFSVFIKWNSLRNNFENYKQLIFFSLLNVPHYTNTILLQQAAVTIVMDADATSALHKRGVATTNDSFKFTWFKVCSQACSLVYLNSSPLSIYLANSTLTIALNYDQFQDHKSVIKAIYTGSEYVERANAGDEVGIILESTSFYAEQGGQVSARYATKSLHHKIYMFIFLFC